MPHDRTPVLVGVGQCVVRDPAQETALPSPMDLLERAARAALEDSGLGSGVLSHLDTLASIRFFEHSTKGEAMVAHPFGCADNVPGALARRLGTTPRRLIYADVGGQTPQRLVNRFCREIAAGEIRCALVAGAEAIASIKLAARTGLTPDWREEVGGEYVDEWLTNKMVSPYERAHGLFLPLRVYPLFEHAQRVRDGRTLEQQRAWMAQVLAPMSRVAAGNPFAQFPQARSTAEIASPSAENFLISEPYTKWMVAQDAVDQGAAVLLMSLGLARELGVPPGKLVFLESHADLDDHVVTARPDLARSAAQDLAVQAALDRAGLGIEDIQHLDVYSCFPIAVTSACESLGIDPIAGRAITLTGGLPFFGGPGNNYSMHAIAEAVARVRAAPSGRAMVIANGGYLSKHSAGIYAASLAGEWRAPDDRDLGQRFAAVPQVPLAPAATTSATVESYVLSLRKDVPDVAYVAARAGKHRLLARVADGDSATLAALRDREPVGRRIAVSHDGNIHRFTFDD